MTFQVGDKFSSFKELKVRIAEYEISNSVHMHIIDSKTLKYAESVNYKLGVNANKALVYMYVVYSCSQGGRKLKTFSTGKSTYVDGCPVKLRFKLDDDGQYLVLHKGLEEHNHEVGRALNSQMSDDEEAHISFRSSNETKLKQGRPPKKKNFHDSQYPLIHKEEEEHNDEVGQPLHSQMSENGETHSSFKARMGTKIKRGRPPKKKNFHDTQYLMLQKGLEEHNHEIGQAFNSQISENEETHSSFKSRTEAKVVKRGRPPKKKNFHDSEFLALQKGLEDHNSETDQAFSSQIFQNDSCSSVTSRSGTKVKRGRPRKKKILQKKSNGKHDVIVLKNLNSSHSKVQNYFGRSDFHSVIYKLQQRKDATVEAVVNDYKVLQGLFFQDFAMKASFEAFPEILLIDSSHKIANLQMPYLYLFITVDGNGECEITAVLLLANETELLIEKMISIFKDYNSRWNEILVMLTDRKLEEKNTLQKEFPNALVLLNSFSILQLLRQEIAHESMNLTKTQQENLLEIMEKLIYSCSDRQYDGNYELLLSAGLQHLVDYFVNNWHPLRSEWIEGFKIIHPELECEKNNKLQRMNEKLSEICDKSSSFIEFFDKLFIMLSSLALEADLHALNIYEKQHIENPNPGSIEELYYEILTPFAFSLIKQQFLLSEQVELPPAESTCKITSCGKEIEVSKNMCECNFIKSTGLPCRHIFAIRQRNQLCLFDDDLVPQRWTAQLYKDKHRVFKALEQLERNWVQMPFCENILKSERQKCCYKTAALVAHELAVLISQDSDSAFKQHMELMHQLLSAWKANQSVFLTVAKRESALVDDKDAE